MSTRLTIMLLMAASLPVLNSSAGFAETQGANGVASGIVLVNDQPVGDALVQIFNSVPEDFYLTGSGGLENGRALPGIKLTPSLASSGTDAARQPLSITTTGDNGKWKFEELVAGKRYLVTTQALGADGAVLRAVAQLVTAYRADSQRALENVQQRLSIVANAAGPPPFSAKAARIYYLTDRVGAQGNATQPFGEYHFANQRSNAQTLTSGTCSVETDGQHRLNCNTSDTSGFFVAMRQVQKQSLVDASKGLVLYFHGFNTNFGDAVRAGGIISTRLHRPVLVYDWASAKAQTPAGYSGDEETLQVSLAQHKLDLLDVLKSPGSTNSVIIAHSLGSRAVVAIARSVADAKRLGAPIDVHLRALVFAAADLYIEDFRTNFDALAALSPQINSYASWKDVALSGSAIEHNGHPRVGDAVKEVSSFRGVISVDASPVDNPSLTDIFGHGYIVGANHILDDVLDLISGVEPRPHLTPSSPPNKYFIFKN